MWLIKSARGEGIDYIDQEYSLVYVSKCDLGSVEL